ncbi:arginine--tRNA ligase, partial [archaeon]|nr:arginine--tRNA ligase [archaeon]
MFEQQIINLLKKQNIKNITLETPPSLELGDYAFPCFSLSKKYKKAPDQIAIDISKKLKT